MSTNTMTAEEIAEDTATRADAGYVQKPKQDEPSDEARYSVMMYGTQRNKSELVRIKCFIKDTYTLDRDGLATGEGIPAGQWYNDFQRAKEQLIFSAQCAVEVAKDKLKETRGYRLKELRTYHGTTGNILNM